MILRPELRALRRDDAPQRLAQAALREAAQAWRERPETAAVLRGVAELAAGAPLEASPALAALFAPGPTAPAFVATFVAAQAMAIAAQPLGHVALRHFTDSVLSTLLLARSGGVTLTLVAIDGSGLAAQPAPISIGFTDADAWEHVLAGTGAGERLALMADGALDRRCVRLCAGAVIARDAEREALLVRAIDGCLVSLRLQRRRASARPSREYALADGALVHQAAGSAEDSRLELMLALLGRMGRADAAPLMAALARGEDSAALRWQALRECLALDTAAGFAALDALAGRMNDPLAAPAADLRARLVARHPELAGILACPA